MATLRLTSDIETEDITIVAEGDGAAAQLGANMPTPMAPLTGPLLLTPNQTYVVSFASVPAGTHKFYCTPHLALGMKGVITVH